MADAATIDVESVNVAEILDSEKAKATQKELLEAFEANPKARKELEAADTAEDVFNIVKKFAKVKWEEFKVLFRKTVDYFKNDKMELDDETLEYVAGGWSFSSIWDKCKKGIVMGTIIVACAAVGALWGFCFDGPIGAAAGAFVGVAVGIGAGLMAVEYLYGWES